MGDMAIADGKFYEMWIFGRLSTRPGTGGYGEIGWMSYIPEGMKSLSLSKTTSPSSTRLYGKESQDQYY
ncbi:hypothetical protein CDAR_312021 [Caerostris darwini]|uniref:Uncharacterized protein n=1 Tax=Caerostris darwini TaxID=1538125 RepID=A0AAV4S877_9ARAC|nr:hypothetical protein CDAR_312021 [Caerostris darwini]